MVGWYHLTQLLKTAPEVAASTVSGRHADHRLVEAMTSGRNQPIYFDYTAHYRDCADGSCELDRERIRNSIWIDYVSDVGDGWNPTYAVALALAQPTLDLALKEDGAIQTRRGDILIFGGDAIYPTPSRENYRDRLLGPYEAALARTDPEHPHLFAIPGNHDWYDSLVAFSRIFMSHRWFAGWKTRQSRSYFALKLPHNWWLLGTDLQLASDIDGPQLEYFERVAAAITEETTLSAEKARVILCHAEPHWVYAAQYQKLDPAYSESNLKLLENRLGADVAVFVAGDLHHYRRYATDDGETQKITSGGGGAFLHPTHLGRMGSNVDHISEEPLDQKCAPRGFKLLTSYPPVSISRRLAWLNLVFPYLPKNQSWTFGLAPAALYLLLTTPLLGRVSEAAGAGFSIRSILRAAYENTTSSRLAAISTLLIFLGFWLFTDTHSRWFKRLMSSVHAAAHFLAAFTLALVANSVASGLAGDSWQRVVAAGTLVVVGGYVVGSLILGVYLLLSLNLFGRHSNEAFSSLAIQDWKNFLRLHIDENGDLKIYPVGIRRVPRKWKTGTAVNGPAWVPEDPQATEPELIEDPIHIRYEPGSPTGVKATS